MAALDLEKSEITFEDAGTDPAAPKEKRKGESPEFLQTLEDMPEDDVPASASLPRGAMRGSNPDFLATLKDFGDDGLGFNPAFDSVAQPPGPPPTGGLGTVLHMGTLQLAQSALGLMDLLGAEGTVGLEDIQAAIDGLPVDGGYIFLMASSH